jgi:hypothetical protein
MKDIIDQELEKKNTFSTASEFSLYIETRVATKDYSYMDAIINYCEEADIEIESIKNLINKSLKEKLHGEAIERNYFRNKSGKLSL